jgi:probable HAF family extracellular repeat protein
MSSSGSRWERFEFSRKTKERFMTKQTLKKFALALGLLGLALIPSTSVAQAGLASKLPSKNSATAAAQAANHQAKTPGTPSYTYTLLSFPGTLSTVAEGINLGATTSKTEIVGGYGPIPQPEGGFLAQVSGTKTVKETYEAVKYPHVPLQQIANAINDAVEIVGDYVDSSGVFHGYERSSGKFTTFNVPFAGAVGTFPFGINNSGEIVGGWVDSNDAEHGFTLIGGTYTSLDYPGGSLFTYASGINSAGEIVGAYTDASGITHGFLLSGGTYTSLDPPGSGWTNAYGINDAGDIVGLQCPTSECVEANDGTQGFLLSQGVYTTVAIPGENFTFAVGINNNGVVLGEYQDAAGLLVSFLATP